MKSNHVLNFCNRTELHMNLLWVNWHQDRFYSWYFIFRTHIISLLIHNHISFIYYHQQMTMAVKKTLTHTHTKITLSLNTVQGDYIQVSIICILCLLYNQKIATNVQHATTYWVPTASNITKKPDLNCRAPMLPYPCLLLSDLLKRTLHWKVSVCFNMTNLNVLCLPARCIKCCLFLV